MRCIAVLLFLVTAASAVSFTRVVYQEWRAFKLTYRKRYESQWEDLLRMKIYAENRRQVALHNQLFERGLVSYSQSLNKYSDLTHEEFVAAMTGYNRTRPNAAARKMEDIRGAEYMPPENWVPPMSIDWTKKGAVTGVKDQDMCASCWAFSATGALEGQHFRRKHTLVSLSEQNLIDCTYKYGNNGCYGGYIKESFLYIRDNRGIDTETSYPYEAMDDYCRYNPKTNGAADVGFVAIKNDEYMLMNAVASAGPVAAAMYGSLETFRHYASGLYYDKRCTASHALDHAVLIVGYGTDKNGPYWLIKNSWGLSWGMQGYAKLARNRQNLCGIANDASYPRV